MAAGPAMIHALLSALGSWHQESSSYASIMAKNPKKHRSFPNGFSMFFIRRTHFCCSILQTIFFRSSQFVCFADSAAAAGAENCSASFTSKSLASFPCSSKSSTSGVSMLWMRTFLVLRRATILLRHSLSRMSRRFKVLILKAPRV